MARSCLRNPENIVGLRRQRQPTKVGTDRRLPGILTITDSVMSRTLSERICHYRPCPRVHFFGLCPADLPSARIEKISNVPCKKNLTKITQLMMVFFSPKKDCGTRTAVIRMICCFQWWETHAGFPPWQPWQSHEKPRTAMRCFLLGWQKTFLTSLCPHSTWPFRQNRSCKRHKNSHTTQFMHLQQAKWPLPTKRTTESSTGTKQGTLPFKVTNQIETPFHSKSNEYKPNQTRNQKDEFGVEGKVNCKLQWQDRSRHASCLTTVSWLATFSVMGIRFAATFSATFREGVAPIKAKKSLWTSVRLVLSCQM